MIKAVICLEGGGESKELFDLLKQATPDCKSPYVKGKKSFELLGLLNAKTLQKDLPSVVRSWRILDKNL